MLKVAPLVYYDLKRLCRHRWVLVALFALPIMAALLRVCFGGLSMMRMIVWSGLIACTLFTWVVMYVRWSTDRASGFYQGLRSTPLSDTDILLARIIAGAILLVLQVGILIGIVMLAI